MMGITGALEIARKSLFANQLAIQVTSHNIANVDTPGYSRQRVQLQETRPMDFSPGQIGTGVEAARIRRSVDRLIESQVVAEQGLSGTLEYTANAVGQVEQLFHEGNGGTLGARIDEFFNAWEDLTVNPRGTAERQTLVSSARVLASAFRGVDGRMRTYRENADRDVAGLAGEVTEIARQIADLNGKIKSAFLGGQEPNDLLDRRSLLLQDLSERINVTTFPDVGGQINVQVANGRMLVSGEIAGSLEALPGTDPVSGETWNHVRIRLPNQSSPAAEDITGTITSGSLYSALRFRDVFVPGEQAKLDSLAFDVASRVNALHAAGFGLDGSTGTDFFLPVALPGAAANLQVNPAVEADLNRVAAASSDPTAPGGSGPGDNGNALLLAALREQRSAGLGGATFTEFLGGMVGAIGAEARGVNQDLAHQRSIVDFVTAQRESVSGVSLDEEMTNLIKYQRAFEAATKLVAVADDLLKQIVDLR